MAVTVAQAKVAIQEHFKLHHANQSTRLFSNFNKFLAAFDLQDGADLISFYKTIVTEEDKFGNLDTYVERTNWKQHGSVRSALSSVVLALDTPILMTALGDSRNDIIKAIHQIQKRLLNDSKKNAEENTPNEHEAPAAPAAPPSTIGADEHASEHASEHATEHASEHEREHDHNDEGSEANDSSSSQCTYQLLVDRLQECEDENKMLKQENSELKRSLRYFTTRTFALQSCFRQSLDLFEQNDEHMLGVISQFLNV